MDELAEKLASLRDGVAPAWTEARRQRVLAGVTVSRRRQALRRVGSLAGCALLAICGLAYVAVRGPSETESVRVHAPEVQPQPHVKAAPDSVALAGTRLLAGQRLVLADGSRVHLAADGGELLVEGNQPEAVALQLAAGSAHFEVVPDPRRSFSVVAGSVSVFVLGTEFDVERAQDRVRVGVAHGRVRVVSAAGEAFVQAGEARWFEQALPIAAAATRSMRGKQRTARAAAPPERLDWRSLHNSGDYERAYQLLARGALVEDEAEALMDAADAARLSNHPDVAANYLGQVLRDHRASASTPLAAFTLGRLLLERLARPAEAAEAFAAAHDMAPRGSLASDALAREVEAWSKAGRADEAYRRAYLFVQTYPNSRRLSAVKQYGGMSGP
jgi:transmembrane sensor